jgi:hypothetical protein
MTRKIIKLLWVIAVLIVVVLILITAYTVWANKTTDNVINESLWTLVDRMDWLRDLKQECADNLGIKDSAKFLKWYSGYCDSWDNEIIELRDKINQISKKDYEGLN